MARLCVMGCGWTVARSLKELAMTILVVDDDREYENVLCQGLEQYGHIVLGAANGNEAFKVLQHHRVDLIVSDIRMPECTGMELHEMVRDDEGLHGLPFVFITGDPSLRVGTPLDDTGHDFIVSKIPFERLLHVIDDIRQN